MLQKDNSTVGVAIRYQKEDAMAVCQDSRAFADDRLDVSDGPRAAKNGIKRSFANDKIKRLVLKRKALGDIRKYKLHRLGAVVAFRTLLPSVLFLHLFDDHWGEINIRNTSFPSISNHVFTECRVSASENQNAAVIV